MLTAEIHQLQMPSLLALLATASVAAWTDWRSWRVPNTLLAASGAAAIMLAVFSPGGMDLAECLLGGIAGIAVFMPLYLLRGMGAGDVKLMGTLGLHAGWMLTLEIALVSSLVGGLLSVMILIKQRPSAVWLLMKTRSLFGMPLPTQGTERLQHTKTPIMKAGSRGTLPYAVVIAMGTGVVFMSRWIP